MKRHRGFTLVEMAVVVVIASILLTLGVKGVTSMLAGTQRTATLDNMNTVRNALLAYFSANHRFPCPDTGPAAGRDGVEDRTTAGNPSTTCLAGASPAAGFGTVPYVDLGLTRAQALDGYGNFISYRIDTSVRPPPVYSATTVYIAGDLITSGGVVYRALGNNITGRAPPPSANPLTFNALTNYKVGDLATSVGRAYRSLVNANIGNTPTAGGDSNWAVADANYSATVTYAIGDFAINAGVLYRSIANGNINNTPPNAAFWMVAPSDWAPLPAGSGYSWYRTSTAALQFNCGRNASGSIYVYSSAANTETRTAAVVLISHGANGLGAWVAGGTAATRNVLPTLSPEVDNTVANPVPPNGYRDYPASNLVAAPNDDIVSYIDSTSGAAEATGAIKTYASSLGRPDICH